MEFRGFHCHFHGVFGLHFNGLPKNLVQNWVTSIFYAFYKFPWIPQILSVESMAPFPWNPPNGFCWCPCNHGCQWKAMEEVEFYRIPRKPWNLICLRIDINCWENGPRTETFILNIKQMTTSYLIKYSRPWKMISPRYFKKFLILLLAAILFLDKNVFMFGFMNTFIYMTRYVMNHIQL